MTQESGLHFLALPLTNALAATYLPADLTHQSYPALVADGAPVSTVAVGSVMAVFAWPQSNERYAKVSRFIDAFFTRFPELLKPPRHPKWKDVNLAAKVPGWTRFGPAQDALARQVTSVNTTGAPNGTGNLRRQFDEYVAARGGVTRMNDAQMAVMFRQFLDWQDRGRPPR